MAGTNGNNANVVGRDDLIIEIPRITMQQVQRNQLVHLPPHLRDPHGIDTLPEYVGKAQWTSEIYSKQVNIIYGVCREIELMTKILAHSEKMIELNLKVRVPLFAINVRERVLEAVGKGDV